MKLLRLAFLPVLMAVASIGHAQTSQTQRPAFTLDRLSVGVRAEERWIGQDNTHLFSNASEKIGFGIPVAYNIVPKLDAVARVICYAKARPEWALGVNLEIFNGPDRAIKAGR